MKYIALDLEMDQPSDRIIQIGAIAMDTSSNKMVSSFEIFIQHGVPVNWSHPLRDESKTLGDLIPYGQDLIDEYGVRPVEAFERFWLWLDQVNCGRKIVQWGTGDVDTLLKQSKETGVHYPKLMNKLRTFNLKQTYKFLYQPASKLPKKYGLQSACEAVIGEFVGEPHNAYYDAENTAYLMNAIFKNIEDLQTIKDTLRRD